MLSRLIIAAVVALALQACAPRGEYSSLDEVLNAAKDRYKSSSKHAASADVSKRLSELEGHLTKLEGAKSATDVAAASKGVVDGLDSLTPRAGYTSRPAMGQLSDQYRKLAATKPEEKVAQPQLKLIVSRTYSLLASELNGIRFAL